MCWSIFASCAASCCCAACQNSMNGTNPYLLHLVIFGIFSVWAIIMGFIIRGDWTLPYVDASEYCTTDACAGNSAVFRTSFVLTVFYALHAIFLLFPKCNAAHSSLMFIKFILLLGFQIWTFWWDNSFFETYGEVARYGSFFYLVLQCMILINWGYDLDEWMVGLTWKKDGSGDRVVWVAWVLAFLVLGLVATEFTFMGLAIKMFGGSGCDRNNFFCAFSIIMTVFCCLGALYVEKGSVLCSAIICFYTTYLLNSALYTDPSDCNSQKGEDSDVYVWTGIVIAAISLCYGAYSLATTDMYRQENANDFESEAEDENKGEPLITEKQDAEDPEEAKPKKQEEQSVAAQEQQIEDDAIAEQNERYSFLKFHICMMLASLYMCMLFTGWGNLEDTTNAFTHSNTTVWVNILTQWATFLLYAWTLTAMHLYPERFENYESSMMS